LGRVPVCYIMMCCVCHVYIYIYIYIYTYAHINMIIFYTHWDDIRVTKLIGRFGFCIVFARFAGMSGCGSDLILLLYCVLHGLSRSQGNNNSRDLFSCLFVLCFTRPEAISGQQSSLNMWECLLPAFVCVLHALRQDQHIIIHSAGVPLFIFVFHFTRFEAISVHRVWVVASTHI